ncbi:MAG: response regulator [Rhodoferax sp.]
MAVPQIEKTFCTTREAALLLGVSIGTVQLWVESNLLQAWKTAGGHRRVLRSSVEGLLHRKSDARQLPPKSESPTAQRALSVMVVEDDPSLLRLYQTRMARWPMKLNLVTADNAVTALLTIGRSGPDLLVTDLKMPFVNGFEMLRILSQAPEIANTTIVVVTGLDADEIRLGGQIPAGIEILPKPIPFERLLAIASGIVV